MSSVCQQRQAAAAASHNHQPVDLWSFDKLPETHVWTTNPASNTASTGGSVYQYPIQVNPDPAPVIDLLAPDAAAQVALAGQTWGIFYVTNHGVPRILLDTAEAEGRRLFELPAETKMKALRKPGQVPGYGVVRIAKFFEKHMWGEGFTVFGDGQPELLAKVLWPENNGHQSFCDVVQEYRETMREVAAQITGMLIDSLGLSDDNADHCTTRGLLLSPDAASALQINSYPPCPDPNNALGLAAHTDSSLITLLYQSDNCTGFQVLRRDDSSPEEAWHWVPVPPVPGALMVNVGDLYQIVSNGRYTSALHRAMVNRSAHRISLAFHYGPPPYVKVQPIKALDDGEKAIYPAVSWNKYLNIKEEHFQNALEMLNDLVKEEEATD